MAWFALGLAQEAVTGTYGTYFQAFLGFAVSIPIEVGSMAPHETAAQAEAAKDKRMRQESKRRVEANLPQLEALVKHFRSGAHPYTEFRDRLSDARPKEHEEKASRAIVPLENQFDLVLPLKKNTTPEQARSIELQFALAQFYGQGPGTHASPSALQPRLAAQPRVPENRPHGDLSPIGKPAHQLCWHPERGDNGLFPLLLLIEKIRSEQGKPLPDDPCTKLTFSLLSLAHSGLAPSDAQQDQAWGYSSRERAEFLKLVVELTPPSERAKRMQPWLERLKPQLKTAEDHADFRALEARIKGKRLS
jgi:hypothetical protein